MLQNYFSYDLLVAGETFLRMLFEYKTVSMPMKWLMGKTNKDTDWRFQAPPNPQVLLPLMAQRESEVGGTGDSSHQKI